MYNQTIDTQQQILTELKTLNSNIATQGDMQDLRSDIQTMSKDIKASIQSASVNKPLQSYNYPSIQAIEYTPSYAKAIKGVKLGRNLIIAGVVIAAGLSNGLSALDVIPEYTYGVYGAIIALGIAMTIVGIVTIAIYAIKSEIKDNPNLVERQPSSNDNGATKHLNDLVHSPAYANISGNIYHHNYK